MKILSLFDGMSVAQQSLKNIGVDVEVYYASEIDEYAKAVTQSNFPNTQQLGGVEGVGRNMVFPTIGANFYLTIEDIDLMIGGSPCQDLSIAKKNREGLKGERSGLFWEYVRIRDEVKPKYFILENVASMPKEAKDTISEALGVEPVMINASLVSAQNRKRLFWVGKWNGEKYEQVEIPQPEDLQIFAKDILKQYDSDYKLTQKTKSIIFRNMEKANKTLILNESISRIEKMSYPSRIAQMFGDFKIPTLTSSMGMGGNNVPVITQNGQFRKLTPTECLRLQSMPECDIIESIWHHITKTFYTNKTSVVVETSNGNSQKIAMNVENEKLSIPVKYVIKSLNTNEVLSEFIVQQNVDILTESIGSLSNQNIQPELHLFVMDVEKNTQNNNQKSEEDFARYLASINIIEAKIILTGLEVLHLKDSNFITPQNGNKLLDKFGQEINHFVTNVAYTIKSQDIPIISTTLNHLRLEKMIEQMLTILSCYASSAIDGFTLVEILKNNSWICPITSKEIKQLTYFDKAEYKGKPISNTQRYKMCGNAFNCAVIEHILKNML